VNRVEHYREAERLTVTALDGTSLLTPDVRIRLLSAAQIHATLAGVASQPITGPFAVSVGDRIRDLRVERGIGQEALANLMHDAGFRWYQQTVARTEASDRALRFDEAITLAELLNVDLAALTTGGAQ
jgi:hypothetical protein